MMWRLAWRTCLLLLLPVQCHPSSTLLSASGLDAGCCSHFKCHTGRSCCCTYSGTTAL